MCGIAGGVEVPVEHVERMLSRIRHRGPDGKGIKESYGVCHGHVRLSLVDLSSMSSQPFCREGGVLSFNGEIWNYKQLRQELEALGDKFITTGDTEVLAAVLLRYGLDGVSKLDGMFSFAWTSPTGKSILVRDRYGKIPLYYAMTEAGAVWCSERKGFSPRDSQISQPLLPGKYIDLNNGKVLSWYTEERENVEVKSPEQILELLNQGVEKRSKLDAPICCLVSGGLDSTLILGLAKQYIPSLVAYTAVFDTDSDDAKSARRVCDHFEIPLTEVKVEINFNMLRSAAKCIEINSKAQIEIAALCIPLAERIYADGFRACLSGEAADELFGGYGNFCIQSSKASPEEVIELRHKGLDKMARGNFVRCNKAFMSNGVECRLPFMERELVDSVVNYNLEQSPPQKKLLKKAAEPIVPSWVIKRPKDTFQGGSNFSEAVEKLLDISPKRWYNDTLASIFGYIPTS